MSCYHPLKALDLGINPDTGKHIIKVLKGEYNKQESLVEGTNIIPIPCGKCIGCRLDYSRQWADRCLAEAQYHDKNIFLTLTYNDKWLPYPFEVNCDSETAYEVSKLIPGFDVEKSDLNSAIHPLVKRHLQLFIKRLRKHFPEQRIRYFACGEYGPKNMRPHYHLILFGLDLPDLVVRSKDPKNGFLYYESDTIKKLWSDPKTGDSYGYHLISDVTWNTCAYVARYIVKKQKGNNSVIYEKLNFPPEFTIMSRKPGIGKQFFDEHPDIVIRDFYIPTSEGAKKLRSNRYYDKLFDIDYHDDLEYIKEERVKSSLQRDMLKDERTSLSYIERLASEELTKEAQTKILKRKEL